MKTNEDVMSLTLYIAKTMVNRTRQMHKPKPFSCQKGKPVIYCWTQLTNIKFLFLDEIFHFIYLMMEPTFYVFVSASIYSAGYFAEADYCSRKQEHVLACH